MKIWKIRNRNTGQYRDVSPFDRWNSEGKSWKNYRNLKLHISHNRDYYTRLISQNFDIEVVECELKEVKVENMIDKLSE